MAPPTRLLVGPGPASPREQRLPCVSGVPTLAFCCHFSKRAHVHRTCGPAPRCQAVRQSTVELAAPPRPRVGSLDVREDIPETNRLSFREMRFSVVSYFRICRVAGDATRVEGSRTLACGAGADCAVRGIANYVRHTSPARRDSSPKLSRRGTADIARRCPRRADAGWLPSLRSRAEQTICEPHSSNSIHFPSSLPRKPNERINNMAAIASVTCAAPVARAAAPARAARAVAPARTFLSGRVMRSAAVKVRRPHDLPLRRSIVYHHWPGYYEQRCLYFNDITAIFHASFRHGLWMGTLGGRGVGGSSYLVALYPWYTERQPKATVLLP